MLMLSKDMVRTVYEHLLFYPFLVVAPSGAHWADGGLLKVCRMFVDYHFSSECFCGLK